MAGPREVVDFELIEDQKENIQALPGGRSAKKLADLYSPAALHKLPTPTMTTTADGKRVKDCIRAEYEAELQNMAESDDPLDIFDRYVRWTLDAFPSAQATPQSQLHILLERATKAFVGSAQYRNDPRYLRLWLHYINFFADAPREAFLFLSRHGIGDGLALFYEEYAAWLEGADRWCQAEEVYQAGIQREARPVQRLLRKFNEFKERLARRPQATTGEPSSPALPTVRPALAAKVDPFSSTTRPADVQARQQTASVRSNASRPKLAVFSDAEAKPAALSTREEASGGWSTIGSLAERKKENTMEPKPWVGETLKAGGKKTAAPRLEVFRDPSLHQFQIDKLAVAVPDRSQVTVHPQTGKKERIFVQLEAIYPTLEEPGTELSFEEIVAANRGWLNPAGDGEARGDGPIFQQDCLLRDENGQPMARAPSSTPSPDHRAGRRMRLMEVNETQISEDSVKDCRQRMDALTMMNCAVKAKLDSPCGTKPLRKNSSEPTMTLHTRAATDDIYELFNAPLKTAGRPNDGEASVEEDDDGFETEGEFTTDAESTGTAKHADASELGGEDDDSDGEPDDADGEDGEDSPEVDSAVALSDHLVQAALPDTKKTVEEVETVFDEAKAPEVAAPGPSSEEDQGADRKDRELLEDRIPSPSKIEGRRSGCAVFIPEPPEDCQPPTRPYRDPVETANNRLPFMTPITERTECSLDVEAGRPRQLVSSPCKGNDEAEPKSWNLDSLSSPLREIVASETPARRRSVVGPEPCLDEPLIKDILCNPMDDAVRQEILDGLQQPLASLPGFYDRPTEFEHAAELRKFARATSTRTGKPGVERQGPAAPAALVIRLPGSKIEHSLKRELGSGAFAPVYLVESCFPDEHLESGEARQRDGEEDTGRPASPTDSNPPSSEDRRCGRELQALKVESPPSRWEFYMMRLAHARLGPHHQAAASISQAIELHHFRDQSLLFLPHYPHGTLLDVVNFFRAEPSGLMDESLAMFLAIELMRTIEVLHAKQIVHGDLKVDNCLLRLDADRASQPLAPGWKADGSGGWSSRGIVLIDFGRSIDMQAFVPEVQFVADWKTSAQDCPEVREGRPWTWQIDYHGLAGIIHCLLFGKYMETAPCDGEGLTRRYKIRENLKRYWQMQIWADCFEMLLNPASCLSAEDGTKMPILNSMRRVRQRMEGWLEANCERGVGLRSLLSKIEAFARNRR